MTTRDEHPNRPPTTPAELLDRLDELPDRCGREAALTFAGEPARRCELLAGHPGAHLYPHRPAPVSTSQPCTLTLVVDLVAVDDIADVKALLSFVFRTWPGAVELEHPDAVVVAVPGTVLP
jgi:hypothetical protein